MFVHVTMQAPEASFADRTEWSSDIILQLIDAYRDRPMLWDSTHKFYKFGYRKNEAWTELARMFDKDVLQVRRKLNSLLASFRRERHKIRIREGLAGDGKRYRSTWFAYDSFGFLQDRYKSKLLQHSGTDPSYDHMNDEPVDENVANGQEVIKEEFEIKEDELEEEDEASSTFDSASIIEETSRSGESPRPQKIIRRKRKRASEDVTLLKALEMWQGYIERQKDECAIFGEYIAIKLRQMNHRTRCITEHAISNVLFDAAMGKFDNPEGRNYLPTYASQEPLPSSSSDQQQHILP